MSKRKPKPAEIARVVHHFADGREMSQSMVELALTQIRQWVAVEGMEVSTAENFRSRESATANLRKVAELAINAEFGLFAVTEGGKKGGKRGSNSKAAAILAEAEKRATIGTGEIQAIAKRSGAHVRTVRDTLTKAGKYTPQKSGK